MKYLIILLFLVINFTYADIQIVATPTCKMEAASKSDIKKLFMLKQQTINDEEITVFDRSEKEIYKSFIERHMQKYLREMKTYWVRMLFTGRKIAPKKLSLAELNASNYEDGCYLSYIDDHERENTTAWKIITIESK